MDATISPEEYLNLGHVVVNVGEDPVGNIDETYLRRTKRRRRVEISTPSFFLAPQLVVGTDRIATITTRLALRYAEILPIKLVPLPIEIPVLVEVLHWHRAHNQDPVHLWFRQILKAGRRPPCRQADPHATLAPSGDHLLRQARPSAAVWPPCAIGHGDARYCDKRFFRSLRPRA